MKKGDLRKQELMDTAEALFCKRGYAQTSVQDILDQLNTSKGSFYHHFISKEALLETICRRRAGQRYAACAESIREEAPPVQNLNALLSGLVPFRDGKLSFLMMLLPVFSLSEGRMIKQGYCEALAEQFMPAVIAQLRMGHEAKELYCHDPENAADIIIALVNRLWVRICMKMIENERQGTESDVSEFLRITSRYRLTAEQTAGLPYGSLELINIPMLKALSEQIHNHWNQ